MTIENLKLDLNNTEVKAKNNNYDVKIAFSFTSESEPVIFDVLAKLTEKLAKTLKENENSE